MSYEDSGWIEPVAEKSRPIFGNQSAAWEAGIDVGRNGASAEAERPH